MSSIKEVIRTEHRKPRKARLDPTMVPSGYVGETEIVPFGYGFVIPTTLFYDGEGPFRWTIEVKVIEGTPRCVGVTLGAQNGSYIDAVTLRRFPLGRLIEEAVVMSSRPANAPLARKQWSSPDEARRAHATAAAEHRKTRRRPQTNRVTDEHLEEVARIYRENEARGNPTEAVARELHAARSTAGRWVMKARHAGKLPPAAGQKATPTRKDGA